MNAPAWVAYPLAAVMLTVTGYCAFRLLAARRLRGKTTELDTDVMHVVMGIAMAGMLVARLQWVPPAAWEIVFAGGMGWFGWRLLTQRASSRWICARPTAHLVECSAMVYMFLVTVPMRPSSSGMPPITVTQSRFSLLALAMTVYLVSYAVRLTDRLPTLAAARPGDAPDGAPGGAHTPAGGAHTPADDAHTPA